MNTSRNRAIPAFKPIDGELADLEMMWRLATAALEAAQEDCIEDSDLDRVGRRVEDLEARVAITPAKSSNDVAIKLRIVLTYEEGEADRRLWFPILKSALADLEQRAALVA